MKILSEDCNSLFNNAEFSDIVIHLDKESMPGHKFLFKIRCPSLLNEVDESVRPCVIDLSKYDINSSKTFLKYLYSGKTDSIYYLSDEEKSQLKNLCTKYNVTYLQSLLSLSSNLEAFCNEDTCSPPHESIISEMKSPGSNKDIKPAFVGTHEKSSTDSSYVHKEQFHTTSRPFSHFSRTNVSPDLFEIDDESSHRFSHHGSSQVKRKLYQKTPSPITLDDSLEHDSKTAKQISNTAIDLIILDSDSSESCHKLFKADPEKESKDSINSERLEANECSQDSDEFPTICFDDNLCETKNKKSNTPGMLVEPNPDSNNQLSKKKSLDVYLQSSLPSICDDVLNALEQPLRVDTPFSSPTAVSSPILKTPKGESSIIISEATPVGEYSKMITPQIKVSIGNLRAGFHYVGPTFILLM